jgi:hypothetical protein
MTLMSGLTARQWIPACAGATKVWSSAVSHRPMNASISATVRGMPVLRRSQPVGVTR